MNVEEFLKFTEIQSTATSHKVDYSRYAVATDEAEKRGCTVVVPGPRELFIDIDIVADLELCEKNVEKIRELEPCAMVVRPSPSVRTGRYHVVVTLERDLTSNEERILLQALLGSDRTREILSWQRSKRGDEVPTLFFEKKGATSP